MSIFIEQETEWSLSTYDYLPISIPALVTLHFPLKTPYSDNLPKTFSEPEWRLQRDLSNRLIICMFAYETPSKTILLSEHLWNRSSKFFSQDEKLGTMHMDLPQAQHQPRNECYRSETCFVFESKVCGKKECLNERFAITDALFLGKKRSESWLRIEQIVFKCWLAMRRKEKGHRWGNWLSIYPFGCQRARFRG